MEKKSINLFDQRHVILKVTVDEIQQTKSFPPVRLRKILFLWIFKTDLWPNSDIFQPPGFKIFDTFRMRLICIDIVPFYFRKCTDLRSFNWPLSEQKSFSFKLSYNLCLQRLKKLKLLQFGSFKKKSLLKPLDQGHSLFSWKPLKFRVWMGYYLLIF